MAKGQDERKVKLAEAGWVFIKTCDCGAGKWLGGGNTIKLYGGGFKINDDKTLYKNTELETKLAEL